MLLTIHQPNGAIAELIDRFVYIHLGETFVQGTLAEMRDFTFKRNFPCPEYEILTDHIMTMSMSLEESELSEWKKVAPGMLTSIGNTDFPSGGITASNGWKSSFSKQVWELSVRYLSTFIHSEQSLS